MCVRVCLGAREREREEEIEYAFKRGEEQARGGKRSRSKKSEEVNVMRIKHPFVNGVGPAVGGRV